MQVAACNGRQCVSVDYWEVPWVIVDASNADALDYGQPFGNAALHPAKGCCRPSCSSDCLISYGHKGRGVYCKRCNNLRSSGDSKREG